MPDNGAVIITGKLDDSQLRASIDKLVNDIDTKLGGAATKFQENMDKMQASLNTFAANAKSKVTEIKDSFQQLGTTFDQFARAMERAAAAASGMNGRGGGSGSSGSGGTGGSGGAPTGTPQTVGELKKMIDEQKRYIENLQLGTRLLQEQVDKLAKQKQLYKDAITDSTKLRQQNISTHLKNINSLVPTNIQEAETKIRRLQRLYANLEQGARRLGLSKFDFLPESMWNRIQGSIARTQKQLKRLQDQAQKPILPKTMSGIMGMSEKTLDDIALKMKAITDLRAKTPIGSADISRLNAEYARLSKLQTEILGKNTALVESNNALGRAFNYIRNRLAFTLTIGAFTGFVRQLYEIRGQYELLERSLGVLLNSFSKGTQIFNELNAMAIKSPFTLIELGTAAKQLTAYNFKANEVVDTTRRLADISSALGVPMERLVYNLGQIRAQTVLTARDARDFANAGLAIVPELAKHFTELEGKVVTTADVFDRMKKKAVSYNDVMSVLYKITDEGGKFFDFQAKQAGTLKVQLANLNLAWNNMLNDMGKSSQATLSLPVKGLREMFLHWKSIFGAIEMAVGALGAYKLAQFIVSRATGTTERALTRTAQAEARANVTRLRRIALTRQLTQEENVELLKSQLLMKNKQAMSYVDYENMLAKVKLSKVQATQLVTMNKYNTGLKYALVSTGTLTQAEVNHAASIKTSTMLLERAKISLMSFGSALKSILLTPTMGIMALATIGMSIASTWYEAHESVKQFNEELAKNSKESYDSLSKFLGSYSNSIGKNLNTEQAKKTWEAMREEIIQSASEGRNFVAELEQINDVNKRVAKGFEYVESIQKVHGALQEVDGTVIKIQEDWSKWWNLWLANDSMIENLDDYISKLHEIQENYDKALAKGTAAKGRDPFATMSDELERLRINLDHTAESMLNLFVDKNFTPKEEREAFNKSVDEMVTKYNMSVEQSLHFRMQLENQYMNQRKALYQKELGDNYRESYSAWIKEFGVRQSLEDEFLKWLSRTHRSEVQKMFGNMTQEEISQINWSEDRWKWWAINNAQEFSKQYNLSFRDLKYLVDAANRYSIRIPVYFDFINDTKDIYETLTDADQAADAAYGKVKRLGQEIDRLKAKRKKTKGLVEQTKVDAQILKTQEEQKKAQEEYNEALEKGGRARSAEADAKKRQTAATKAHNDALRAERQAESELQKAFREEIQIIDNARKAYSELTKAGMSNQDALEFSTKGFEKSIAQINSVFKKWGIEAFDLKKYAGVSNPREILTMFENQLNKAISEGKAKPEEIKEVEMKIKDLKLDAEKYDLKKITDGLNNELSKVKEEYELAVELDANPELGGIFADMMGISKEQLKDLPHDFQDVLRLLQNSIDNLLGKGKFSLIENLNKADFDAWALKSGGILENKYIEVLNSIREYANKVRLDETKKLTQEWNKLLEKYSEYEYKRIQITKDAERKLEVARKSNAGKDIVDAIINEKNQELAKLNFEKFQKSSVWITATNDLSKLSSQALQMLIDKIVDFKRKEKDLDPKQIQKINKVLRQLRKEQMKDNPFKTMAIAMQEAQERTEDIQMEMDELEKKIFELQGKWQDVGLDEEEKKILKEYIELFEFLKRLKEETAEIPFLEKVKAIDKYVQAFKQVSDAFKQIADSTNNFDLKQAADAVSDVIGNIEAAEKGAESWGGWWGAIIGGVTDAIHKILKWVSGNAKIDYDIQQSQLEVKRLSVLYEDLEHSAQEAYGVVAYGAQKALIINKQLQLEQLKEQLRLEKSRKSKYQDKNAIIELQGQINDLEYEIHDATNNIVNDLLGISSKADFAENLVKSMIESFKNGEDYMKVFEESFENMVDNMIMKAIVSRLVGDWIDSIWDRVNAKAASSKKAQDAEKDIKYAEEKMKGFIDVDEDLYNFWKKKYEEALATYNEAITPTPEDIASMRELFAQGRDEFKDNFLAYMDAFGITFGQNAGKADLSALQQGIQGITEDTAGALEAYMNGVSQQVYLHSDLLTQIRDILINFGGDVNIATNAQILFTLQQSYQTQMTIQTILQGWSNPSGLAMRVELTN